MNSELKAHFDKQTEFNARQAKSIDGLVEDVGTLTDSIKELKDLLANATGVDDEVRKKIKELEDQGESLTSKLESLDAQNPPTPPTDTGDTSSPAPTASTKATKR